MNHLEKTHQQTQEWNEKCVTSILRDFSGILFERFLGNNWITTQAFFDTLTLIVGPLVSCMKPSKSIFRIAYPYIIWPSVHFSQDASLLMTLVIAYERFIAVCHPLNSNKGQRHRVIRYVSFVTIISLMGNVTKLFEYEPDDCDGIRFTGLYINQFYIVYNIIIYQLCMRVLVMVLLIYLYAKIYMDIKASHTTHSTCSFRGARPRSREIMRKSEGKQARMFAGVVVTSLICYIPHVLVTAVHIIKLTEDKVEPPLWFLIAVKVRDFFGILNAAVNIVIYTCLSKQFRGEIRGAFCRQLSVPPDTPNVNSIHLRDSTVIQTQRHISFRSSAIWFTSDWQKANKLLLWIF